MEWSFEDFKESSMFSHVCIDNEDDETCIEELGQESSFDHCCFLLTYSVHTYPANKFYNKLFKDNIYSDNDSCNRECKYLW